MAAVSHSEIRGNGASDVSLSNSGACGSSDPARPLFAEEGFEPYAEEDWPVVAGHEPLEQLCRALWGAVILEQFKLVVAPKVSDRGFEQDQARRWFGSPDFFMCCALARLAGEWILAGALRAFEAEGGV